jgi:hypothetical protein
MGIREEYRFLARESSHEDVVSTIACAVETSSMLLRCCVVFPHEEHRKKRRDRQIPI